MNRGKAARTTPAIAGSPVFGRDDRTASPGSSVYKHQGKYHVFVGLSKVLVTEDLDRALTEAAQKPKQ